MTEAIAVFARAPIPGQAKTRLARELGHEAAAELYLAMLRDTLEAASQAASMSQDCDVMLYFTPATAFAPGPHSLDFWQGLRLAQSECDLGHRLLHCLDSLRLRGYERIVVIGSDSPDLSPTLITAAFTALDLPRYNLVFGPADDGGFYLMGVKSEVNGALFEAVAWSSDRTLAQILSNAARLDLRVAQLPQWSDIDTPADLRRLITRAAEGRPLPSHTGRWLQSKNLL